MMVQKYSFFLVPRRGYADILFFTLVYSLLYIGVVLILDSVCRKNAGACDRSKHECVK